MVKVSFVIVTYFSHDLIEACVESIYAFTNGKNDFEIIIVDQSSQQGYEQLRNTVNKYNDSRFTIIHNSANGGYGQGNNIGIRAAKGSHIVIVNPDVIFPSSGYEKIIAEFQGDSNLAILGGKQFGGINLSFWVRPEYNFPLFTTPLSKICNKLNLYVEKYMFLSGALLIIDKKKFHEIGMFDENIFLYFEESDVMQRFLKRGYKTKFIKDFHYQHLIDDDKEFTDRHFTTEFKSAQYYFKKYHKNFKSFLERKIISYQIQLIFLRLLGRTKSYQNTKANLNRVLNLKINDSH